jgi:glycosyltransferase involved in cell wall biosynthesis
MRILLLTSYFYPDEHIGASRWNRLSKYLQREGHEIFVVASENGALEKPLLYSTRTIRVNSESSLPDRLLARASNAKRNSSLEKERQDHGIKEKKILVSAYSALVTSVGKIARFPNRQWWSAGEMVKAGLKLVRTENIDVIVATHPHPGCLKAASLISAATGKPWIADMRDGWSSYYDLEYLPGTFLHKRIVGLEKKYLNNAAKVVAVNRKLAESLCVSNNKLAVIPNSYESDEITFAGGYQTIRNQAELHFAFAGTVLPDHYWDVFLQGIAQSAASHKDIRYVINYYGGSFDLLLENALASGVPKELLVDHGYLSRNDLKKELRKADFLVVFGFKGAFGNTVTTGKIFDYIEAEKPVMVAGRSDSELASLVSETGIGFVATEPGVVKNIIDDFLTDPNSFNQTIKEQRKENEIIKYSSKSTAEAFTALFKEVTTGK